MFVNKMTIDIVRIATFSAVFFFVFYNSSVLCTVGGLSLWTIKGTNGIINMNHGEPLELFCTGPTNELKILKDFEDYQATSAVNETTVRFLEEKPKPGMYSYYCKHARNHEAVGVTVSVIYTLRFMNETRPEARNFRCISKNSEFLNCTWTSLVVVWKTYRLFYIEEGLPILLCRVTIPDSMFCVWDTRHPSFPREQCPETLTFLMEICDFHAVCRNQTFQINYNAAIKPDPPSLTLSRRKSHSVALKWSTKLVNDCDTLNDLKITYFYSGIYQIHLNTSDLHIMQYSVGRTAKTTLYLDLPCANMYYEVSVSTRPITAGVRGFWSDESVISFTTDPEPKNAEAAVDPSCTPQRVKITPEIMLYEIEKFRDRFMEEQKGLKEKIRSLKRKEEDINRP